MAKIDVNVPDIGDFKDVPIIEVLVKPGDVVKAEQSLVTLESDKATMDVPSPTRARSRRSSPRSATKCRMGTLIACIDSAGSEAARTASACQARLGGCKAARAPRPRAAPASPGAATTT